MYFSRVRNVSRNARRLHPDQHHRQIWKFFPDIPAGERPFIFRFDLEKGLPTFYIVSSCQPQPDHHWRLETKPYAPKLEPGDPLRFSLRINPTIVVDHKRYEPVSQYKRNHPDWYQETTHAQLEQEILGEWLTKNAERWGFQTDPRRLQILNYQKESFAKKRRNSHHRVQIAVAEVRGSLEVTDPERFKQYLFEGMGRAKGFGCGLMMVRRAS